MVSFLDDTMRYSAAGFDSALFDTTHSMPGGSAFDYYQWVSGGRLRLSGRIVANVMLPHSRQYYGALAYGVAYSATPNNMYGALYDALTQCSRNVDWSEFDRDRDGYVDMVWLLHAGPAAEVSGDKNDFWSLTSRMSATWRDGSAFLTAQPVAGGSGLFYRIDRFSTVPELSGIHPGRRSEIGVFCHEFGHALGLPDLYDTTLLGGGNGNVGPGNWSLMSTGGYGGNGSTPESPSHLGAWASTLLGWTNVVRPANDTTITLDPISSGGPVVDVWYQGEFNPEHFLLECRAKEGFDASINIGGLLISHADEAGIGQRLAANRINAGSPGLWLVEADGDSDLIVGRNRGDAFDPFPGLDAVHSIGEHEAFDRNFCGSADQRLADEHSAHRQSGAVRSPRALIRVAPCRGPLAGFDPNRRSSIWRWSTTTAVCTVRVVGGCLVVLRSRVRGVWERPAR
jgi:immune inhibitor A